MKRLALLLLLCGCAGVLAGSDTFIVAIENDNWSASTVTVACDHGRRLAQFRGLMRGERFTKRVELPASCSPIIVTVRMLGGREVRPEPQIVQPGDTLFVVIPLFVQVVKTDEFVTPFPGGITPYGAADSMGILVDARVKQPLGIHYGIWRDVERCVGMQRDPTSVRWLSARMILMQSGGMAYGMTALNEDRVPYMIAIEWGHWLDSRVISHEAVHAITGITDNAHPLLARCTMNFAPMDTVERFAHPDTIAKYLSGGN